MERTLALIAKSHQGDKKARNTLVEENIGLVYSIVPVFWDGALKWKIWCRSEASV